MTIIVHRHLVTEHSNQFTKVHSKIKKTPSVALGW
jgi:hypothetical protein